MNNLSKQQQFTEKQSKNKQQSSDEEEILQQQVNPKHEKQTKSENQISRYSQIQKIKQYLQFMFNNSNSLKHQKSSQKDQTHPKDSFSYLCSSQIKNLQQNLLKYITKLTQISQQNQLQYFLQKNQNQKFFSNLNQQYKLYQQSLKLKINQKLLKSKRFYISISNANSNSNSNKFNFNKQIQIKKIYHSKHYEIVTIKIQLLEYETEIRILNELQKNSLHTMARISSYGGFGNVYFVKVLDERLAIKCIPFTKANSSVQNTYQSKIYMKEFMSILKEYFFNLLFSQLEIGPKVKTIGGFDLIFNQKWVQFASQICQNAQINVQFEQDLKQSLKIFHLLKIVHRDIKPTNIMYSKTLKKNVFIDFGVSQVIQETVGHKTMTSFRGTTTHCTQQLFSLIHNIKGYVDLYFNDIFALKKSISEFLSKQNQNNRMNNDKNKCQQIKITQNPLHILLHTSKHKLYYYPLNNNKISHNNNQISIQRQKQSNNQLTFLFNLINIQINKSTYNNNNITKDQIDIKILYFLYQLNTINNSAIIKYFQQEIQQYIQELEQFVNLKKFIRNYSQRELFVYYKNQNKQNMYLFFKQFYQLMFIEFNYGLEDNQKFILRIIGSNKLIEEYIQKFLVVEKFNQLFLLNGQYQNLLENKNFHVLCIVLLKYLTLTNNMFGIEMVKKLKVCQNFIKNLTGKKHTFLSHASKNQNQFDFKLIFKCIQQRFEPLAIYFQFFLLHLWKKINFKYFISQVFLQSLINLCLLGYPTNLDQAGHHILQLMFSKKNLQKIQKIILYWQVKLLFMTFDGYFYQQGQNNFYLQSQDQINTEFHSQKYYEMQKSLFLQQKNNNITLQERFITINYQFYKKINSKNHKDEIEYKKMFTQLKQHVQQQDLLTYQSYQKESLQSSNFIQIPKFHIKSTPKDNLPQQLIKKWLIVTYYIVYLKNQKNFRLNLEIKNNCINQQFNKLIFQYSRSIYNKKQTNFYYFLILTTIQTTQDQNSINTNLYLQKLFNEINQPTISFRLFIVYQFNLILVKQIPLQSIQKFIQILSKFQGKHSHINYYHISILLQRINIDMFFMKFVLKRQEKQSQGILNDAYYVDNNKKKKYLRQLYLNLYYKIFSIALEYAVIQRENEKKKSNLNIQLKQYKIQNINQLQKNFQKLKFDKKFFIKLIQLGQKFLKYKQNYPTLLANIFVQQKHLLHLNQLRRVKLQYYNSITSFYQKIIKLQEIQNIFKLDKSGFFYKLLEEVLRQHENLHNKKFTDLNLKIKNKQNFLEQFFNLEIINKSINDIEIQNSKSEQNNQELYSLNSIDNKSHSVIKLPSITLIIQYYEYKLIKSNYHVSECKRFFKLIQFLRHKQLFNNYIFKPNLLQNTIFVYILLYSQKIFLQKKYSYNQTKIIQYIDQKGYNRDVISIKITDIRQILEQITRIIRNAPSVINISLLTQHIKLIFSINKSFNFVIDKDLSGQNKISNQNQNQHQIKLNQQQQKIIKKQQFEYTQYIKHWQPFDLIKELYNSIQCLNYYNLNEFVKENQYMALVYCLCDTGNLIPYKMSKLFLKYLDKYSKKFIQNRIYQTILVTFINYQEQLYLISDPKQTLKIDLQTHWLNILKLWRKKRHILISKVFRRQKQHFISEYEVKKLILAQKHVKTNKIVHFKNKINRYLFIKHHNMLVKQ